MLLQERINELDSLIFNSKDNALCVIQENDIEAIRFKYVVIKRGTLNYKDSIDGKDKSKIYILRVCQYTDKYNLYESTRSLLFDTKEDLVDFLTDEYNIDSLAMLR